MIRMHATRLTTSRFALRRALLSIQGGTSIDDVTEAIDNCLAGTPEQGGEFDSNGYNKMKGVGPYRVTKTMGR